MTTGLKSVFAVLCILGLFFLGLHFFLPESSGILEDIAGMGGNLAAEIFGILITVFIVDRIISKRNEEDRQRKQALAIRELKKPLTNHLSVLSNMYVASVSLKPETLPRTLEALFDASYFLEVANLDLTKPAPISYTGKEKRANWFEYIACECRRDLVLIDRVLSKYAIFLDEKFIDSVEVFRNAPLFSFSEAFELYPNIGTEKQEYPKNNVTFFGDIGDVVLKPHCTKFVALLSAYNQYVSETEKIGVNEDIWLDNIAPGVGSSRSVSSTSDA